MNLVEALKFWISQGLDGYALVNGEFENFDSPKHYYIHEGGFLHSCSNGVSSPHLAIYAQGLVGERWGLAPICPVCKRPVRPDHVGYCSDVIHVPKCDGRQVKATFCSTDHRTTWMRSEDAGRQRTYMRLLTEPYGPDWVCDELPQNLRTSLERSEEPSSTGAILGILKEILKVLKGGKVEEGSGYSKPKKGR